ncbi:hypothetical protein AK812_SmicGene30792 [Symbiodinium microadriaticum]|uniref:Uncharacterized protein n=1 Tax=Symbiodinium microadriaticum TaxID=2951 RepID=A0A1Q9CYB4_SYMMI|nr:hypothetical protein AK812_SmicGene30792 [Symbiodinium microadriaticum]
MTSWPDGLRCNYGTQCYRRNAPGLLSLTSLICNPEHLNEHAHPWDDDYLFCCEHIGKKPESDAWGTELGRDQGNLFIFRLEETVEGSYMLPEERGFSHPDQDDWETAVGPGGKEPGTAVEEMVSSFLWNYFCVSLILSIGAVLRASQALLLRNAQHYQVPKHLTPRFCVLPEVSVDMTARLKQLVDATYSAPGLGQGPAQREQQALAQARSSEQYCVKKAELQQEKKTAADCGFEWQVLTTRFWAAYGDRLDAEINADEYSREEDGLYTVLLCAQHGDYDCILGDRIKISGTYREFIVFDTENVYPEQGSEFCWGANRESVKSAGYGPPTEPPRALCSACENSASFAERWAEGTSDMLELLVERDGTRRPVNRRKFAGHAGHSMLLADLSEIFNDMLCSSTPSNTLRISLCLSSVSLPGAVNVSIFRISRPLQSVGETRLAVTNRIGPDKTHDGNDALSILSNIALLLRSSNRHSIHESLTKVLGKPRLNTRPLPQGPGSDDQSHNTKLVPALQAARLGKGKVITGPTAQEVEVCEEVADIMYIVWATTGTLLRSYEQIDNRLQWLAQLKSAIPST